MKIDRVGILMSFVSMLAAVTVVYIVVNTPRPVVPEGKVVPSFILVKAVQQTEFEATGYSIGKPYSVVTKMGVPVINKGAITVGGIDFFTIAVDPKIIPLGSMVYIDSLGVGMATDTGRKIKGMIIDICFRDMNMAMHWGRRKVMVTVLRRGM